MYALTTLSHVWRRGVVAFLVAAILPAVAMAVDLPPGGSTPLAGVLGGTGGGAVFHDSAIPFRIHTTQGTLIFEGTLRDRIVRLDATGTLSFVRQIRPTNGDPDEFVGRVTCGGYSSFLTDVDFSTTSLGTVTPDSASRTSNGAAVTFHFDRTPISAWQDSKFFHITTEALEFAEGGKCTIRLVSGEEVSVPVVRPIRNVELGCRPIDFEDLPLRMQIPAGGTFASNGVLMHLEEFYLDVGSCTNPTPGNFVRITDAGEACGSGHELTVNNVNVRLDYGVTLTDLVIRFGEMGGNVNLTVNGHCVSERNLSDVPPFMGGVSVSVDEPNPGRGCGKITLHGPIHDVSIGGQEFWIDDIECTPDVCQDDDTPPIAEITEPSSEVCVCDPVEIIGTADDANFDRYVLEYRRTSDPTWHLIDTSTTPVIAGALGMWNAAGLPQGRYLIRLTVDDICGNSETAVSMVWLGTTFDTLTIREPDDGDVVGGLVCVDGTAWDNYCFDRYSVEYQPAGGVGWDPVDPANPVYTTTVINDPIAHWETVDLSLPDGDYLIRARGLDDCGNDAEELREVVVDNTWPVAEITSPAPCDYVEGVVEVIGTALDQNIASWTLQYTGGDESGWVTIESGTSDVFDDLLGEWDTTALRSCAYTLRLVVRDSVKINCNNAIHHWSEYTASVNVGACGDFDVDDDGDVDLFDYSWFERAFTGPQP